MLKTKPCRTRRHFDKARWKDTHLIPFPVSCREEEESLRDKIRADHERALQEAKEKLRKSREELQAEIQTEKNKVVEDLKKKDAGPKPLPPVPMPKVVGVSDGEPPEPDAKEKRDKIREVRPPVSRDMFYFLHEVKFVFVVMFIR